MSDRYECATCGYRTRTKREMASHHLENHTDPVPEPFPHGEDRGYYRHRAQGIPFPEDEGGEPCGCRKAHSIAVNRNNKQWVRGYGFLTFRGGSGLK